jgi:GDP-L-fucose synthase
VIPGLIQRIHKAKEAGVDTVQIWGTGTARREFLHVHDMASACIFLMQLESEKYWSVAQPRLSHINVGSGVDCSIAELVTMLADVIDYKGNFSFDTSKPDGTPKKVLDVSRLQNLGWQASIPVEEGLSSTYQWYLEKQACLA